jgi:hypothetical protein
MLLFLVRNYKSPVLSIKHDSDFRLPAPFALHRPQLEQLPEANLSTYPLP